MSDLLAELAKLPEEDFPDWEDSADLGRLHLQSFAQDQIGGFELSKSRGALRLTGDGVRGHSLDLADAGQVLAEFQNLVTVSGAALQGQTGVRGRLRADVVERTRLALSASPGPGSVVLEFEPVIDEASERYPKGETRTDGPPIPLVEQSVETALDVLAVANGDGPNFDVVEAFFQDLGPRVAAAARTLATTAAKASLDLNVGWERPGVGRKSVRVSSRQCASFASVLHGIGLDSEQIPLTGILRTVSDRKKIDLETADLEDPGETVVLAIARGDVNMQPYNIGTTVTMLVRVEVTQRPGGTEKREFTALHIALAEG